jgi:hypothetical protein
MQHAVRTWAGNGTNLGANQAIISTREKKKGICEYASAPLEKVCLIRRCGWLLNLGAVHGGYSVLQDMFIIIFVGDGGDGFYFFNFDGCFFNCGWDHVSSGARHSPGASQRKGTKL